MRKLIVALFMIGAFIFATPTLASADTAGKCCSDGKAASVAQQKSVCKGMTGTLAKKCKALAKLPDWWMPVKDNTTGDYYNVHRPNGVVIVKAIKGSEPKTYNGQPLWLNDFKKNIKEYQDNHAHIS